VKLSDNPNKASGEREEIARYRRIFGTAGQIERALRV
jgi:nicotinate phosphoribosyltransferase